MSPDCAPDEARLRERIAASWALMPAVPLADLEGVKDEEGPEVFTLFAGLSPLEVDRQSELFDEGFPLLFMSPAAAVTYLGTYMLVLLDTLPLRREGRFVFDHRLRAHLFGMLADRTFICDVVRTGLNAERRGLVIDFIKLCVSSGAVLDLDSEQCADLNEGARLLTVEAGGRP